MDANGRPNNPSAPIRDESCARCGGLLVVTHYMDLQDDTGQISMTAWRCTGCGEVIDPTILRNRKNPTPNLLYGTKQRAYARRVEPGESSSGGRHGGGTGAPTPE